MIARFPGEGKSEEAVVPVTVRQGIPTPDEEGNITNRWTSRLEICLDRPNFVLIVWWGWMIRRRWSTLC
jgi:hypothetical protein